ncbi:MAG: hypothetical protein LBU26_06990 [Synergistaceae bacterium]|jgi:hypothetical protein|nr:hypothetical protein [Synergistaceae bacterium]
MGTEITLPSGKLVEIIPVDGKTERLLEDKKLIQSGAFIDKYLTSRIEAVDADSSLTPQQKEKFVLDLRSGDRNYLLYQLRIESYGPEMVFNHECPSCKKTSGYKADLKELLADGDIKIHPYRDEPLRVELPRSGGYAVVDYMTGHEERRLSQKKDKSLSDLIHIRVKELNGKPPSQHDLDGLIGEDMSVIRGAIDIMSKGGLDPLIELTCLECGRDYKASLASIDDFFVPTRTNTGIDIM